MSDLSKRKFYQEDLAGYFLVKHLHEPQFDELAKELLVKHDMTQDEKFSDPAVPRRIEFYGQYLERGFNEDRRFYVQYISPEIGFGLFADLYIPAWTIVGEYTGTITASLLNTDYAWAYQSSPLNKEGDKVKLRLNARDSGNLLRFVNHSDYPNCSVIHVPYKNMWRTFYLTNSAILPGQELSVFYGDIYWKERNKIEDKLQSDS